MPVTITINGENADQAIAELMSLSGGFNAAPALYAEEVPAGEERAAPEPKVPGRRKGQATKVVEVAEVELAAVDAAPANNDVLGQDASAPPAESPPEATNDVLGQDATADDKAFTEDDARKALIDLGYQPDGKALCRAVLTEFGVTKISEIKPEARKDFIAAIAKKRGL